MVLDWVRPLLELYPNVAHLHFIRGEALRLLGRLEEALVCLHVALALPSAGLDWEPWTTRSFCWNAIGAMSEQLGRPDLALQAYRESLHIGLTPFAHRRRAALEVPAACGAGAGAAVATGAPT